jgi:hypothetical protein
MGKYANNKLTSMMPFLKGNGEKKALSFMQ